ncbi:VOC family protein [Rummeliibacillus pycnus]|uniref:VOC family protein n=1 Tax=Rummeliibacillus pycnus TaxID=101070 RepID=UPI0037C9FF4D
MARVIGFELSSQEPEKATEFYSKVFGWEIAEPKWEYWAVTTGNNVKPGIDGRIGKGPNDFPHGTRIQIQVNSIDDAISKAKSNGAMIVRDKMEFDDFYLAYLVDPVGLSFGLIQHKSKSEVSYLTSGGFSERRIK